MTLDDLLLEAGLADRGRETAGAALARTLNELYGACRCVPGLRKPTSDCERHTVAAGLFRRLIWSGLGA